MPLILKMLLTVLMLNLLPANTSAAEIENVHFEESYTSQNKTLVLKGVSVLRYLHFIKAYAGALYMEDEVPTDQVLLDRAKRLEVEYFHALKGQDFGKATLEGLSENLDPKTLERLRPKIDYHNSLYEDVKPGDRYSLTYIPGRGTELALNGESKGIIEGADFAAAIYTLWLGPRPYDKAFRQGLMGKN